MMDNRQFRKMSNIADMSGRSAGLGWTNWVPGWSVKLPRVSISGQWPGSSCHEAGQGTQNMNIALCVFLSPTDNQSWSALGTEPLHAVTLHTDIRNHCITVQQLRHWLLVDLFPDDRPVIIPHWLKQFRIQTHQERITAYCNQYKPALNQSRNVIVGQPLLRY